jgi:hypothetical protein
VTPATVKKASQEHSEHLVTLGKEVGAYRALLNQYYDALVQRERDAFVAQMVGKDLNRVVSSQVAELGTKRVTSPVDRESQDFIAIGIELASSRDRWRKQFDLWLTLPGALTIEDKRAQIRTRIEALDDQVAKQDPKDPQARSTVDAMNGARRGLSLLLEMSDDELSYVIDALHLNQQRANLNRELEILSLQLQVMEKVHGVVDSYLQIDATIDGAKIGEAARAGASVDISKYPELSGILSSLSRPAGGTP